jgi:hypothetical protein
MEEDLKPNDQSNHSLFWRHEGFLFLSSEAELIDLRVRHKLESLGATKILPVVPDPTRKGWIIFGEHFQYVQDGNLCWRTSQGLEVEVKIERILGSNALYVKNSDLNWEEGYFFIKYRGGPGGLESKVIKNSRGSSSRGYRKERISPGQQDEVSTSVEPNMISDGSPQNIEPNLSLIPENGQIFSPLSPFILENYQDFEN